MGLKREAKAHKYGGLVGRAGPSVQRKAEEKWHKGYPGWERWRVLWETEEGTAGCKGNKMVVYCLGEMSYDIPGVGKEWRCTRVVPCLRDRVCS